MLLIFASLVIKNFLPIKDDSVLAITSTWLYSVEVLDAVSTLVSVIPVNFTEPVAYSFASASLPAYDVKSYTSNVACSAL